VTPADVIAEVRSLVQDSRTPYRYSDELLLGLVNQTLKRAATLRPDLFGVIGDIPTTPNTVLQSCPAGSTRLIEIFQVKGGSAITEVSRDMLDQTYPQWTSDAAGTPVNFMRHVRNPNKFFLHPSPSAGIVLVGEYSKSPDNYLIDETIDELPETYFSAIVDGTVWLAESIDNEHVNTGRAKMYQEMFVQLLGVNLQSRPVTDTESGGMDRKQVI